MGDGAVGEPGSEPLGRLLAGIDALLWVGGWLEGAVVVAGEEAEPGRSAGVDIGSAPAGSVEGSELFAGALAAAQGGWVQAFGAGWARASGALSITIIALATRDLICIAARSSTSVAARTTSAVLFGSMACQFCGAA